MSLPRLRFAIFNSRGNELGFASDSGVWISGSDFGVTGASCSDSDESRSSSALDVGVDSAIIDSRRGLKDDNRIAGDSMSWNSKPLRGIPKRSFDTGRSEDREREREREKRKDRSDAVVGVRIWSREKEFGAERRTRGSRGRQDEAAPSSSLSSQQTSLSSHTKHSPPATNGIIQVKQLPSKQCDTQNPTP